MSEIGKFFSDPKVIISLLALLISIISFLWTLANQWEQNRRWNAINSANIILKEIMFSKWKEFSKEEAMATKWGYEPSIYGGGVQNKYYLPYSLVVRNTLNNEKIANVNPVYSIEEAQNELKRVGFKGDVFLTRVFRPKFVFENIGKSDAYDISIKIDSKQPDTEWINLFSSNSSITLSSSQVSTVFFDFEIPLNNPVPPILYLSIKLIYADVNDSKIEKEIKAKWTSDLDFWSYGEEIKKQ